MKLQKTTTTIEKGDKNPFSGVRTTTKTKITKNVPKISVAKSGKLKFKTPKQKKKKRGPPGILGHEDRSNFNGTAALIHSFLDSDHGYHRGESSGFDETAMLEHTTIFNVDIAAGTVFNWVMAPFATDSINWLVTNIGGTTVQSPYVNTAPAVSTNTASPYRTLYSGNAPGTTARCMGCEVIFEPTVAPLNMAGNCFSFYKSVGYLGSPGASTLAIGGIGSGNSGWTENNIHQSKFQLRTNGTQSFIVNAIPGSDETRLRQTVQADDEVSVIGGYIKNGGSAPISYNVRIRYIVEYVPIPAVLVLTTVSKPRVLQTCWEDFTTFCMNYWDLYILNTLDNYKMAKRTLNSTMVADYVYRGLHTAHSNIARPINPYMVQHGHDNEYFRVAVG